MKIAKIISNVIFVLVLALSGLFFLAHFTNFLPLRIFIVSSGSMEPAIKTGSLVFVVPSHVYRTGDIITFKTGSKTTTTHRLVAVSADKFRTAGDANNQPDFSLISANQILGKVFYITPYLGYTAAFAKTPPGFILFVIVPATIIVYEELKGLILQIKKINSPSIIKPVFLILPVFFAAFILITVKSISYFSDTEISSGNSFTAFATTPTVTPTPHPVINEVASAVTGNDEWIEIYNPSSSPLDLSGWRIRDNAASEEDIVPSVTPIPANGYGVIMASDGNSSLIPLSAIPIVLSDSTVGNNLNNGGDRVLLKTQDGTIIDQMSYGSDNFVFPTPPAAPTSSQSLARSPNGTDTDTATDWVIDSSPSIGVAN